MPPVREASTKPSAATVLPAPVACSNQKRRAAPGSSTAASAAASSSASSAGSQSSGSSSGSSSPSISTSPVGSSSGGAARPLALFADLQLGRERDQRARQGVDLVGVEGGAVGQVRLLVGEQPLEAEHQRIGAPPLDRGLARGRPPSRRARPRGRRGARCPARAPAPASSPGSTKLSRANSSARERTSPANGASARAELVSATFGVLVMGKGPEPSWPSGSQRGPPVVPGAQESPASVGRAGPMRTVGVALLQHTNAEMGLPSFRRCAASPFARRSACCSWPATPTTAPSPLRARTRFLDGGRPAFEAFVDEAARHARSWSTSGPPGAAPAAPSSPTSATRRRKRKGEVVFVGVDSERQRRRRARVPRRQPGAVQALQGPASSRSRPRSTASRRSRRPPSTTPTGELAFVHQGGYQSEDQLAEDIDRYAR